MPTIVQFRRGTQTQNNNFLGSAGELSVNTTANALRVHDGTQTGGYELARSDLSNVTTGILTSLSVGTGAASTEVISSARQLKNITSLDTNTKNVISSSILNDTSLNVNIGIVTASRLRTGSSLTIQNNDISTPSGIVTASLYYGSGINLSGVVTSIVAGSGIQITSNSSGIVTVTSTGGGSGGGGISAIQLQSNGIVVGSAGTFNFTNDFNVPIVGSGGIGTISLSQTKTFSVNSIQPTTTGTGFIGTVGYSWGGGNFSSLTVDNDLNITNRASIPSSSQLRFGTGNNVLMSYDGTGNRFNINLQNTVVDFAINNGSTAQFVFTRSDGRLGIGVASPTEALDVTGNIKASQTISAADFNTTSDVSLKTDISTIENALELISSIRGVRFVWKDRQTQSLGVIAQEVEEIIPELVTDGNPKQVNYNGLIGVLVESVKQLNDQVGDLRKENESIKKTLNLVLSKLS